MECEWSNVVKAGQKVKVKMKDEFVDVVVEKLLFLAKLASNGTYYYATAKVIVRLYDDRTSELQFRDIHL